MLIFSSVIVFMLSFIKQTVNINVQKLAQKAAIGIWGIMCITHQL